jgi:hypothetical protein
MKAMIGILIATMGCAASGADEQEWTVGEPPTSSGKSDTPQSCGNDGMTCEPSLCGADYDAAGQFWNTTCAPSDQTTETFVAVSVTGGVTTMMDSRALTYQPAVAVNNEISNAALYGCMVLPESTSLLRGPEDGVTIQFAEFEYLSWNIGVPTRSRRMMYVHTDKVIGPGVYDGYAGFQENNLEPTTKYGGLGIDSDCEVHITTNAQNGLSGTFTCDVPAYRAEGSVTISGEFNCPMNTLRRGVWTKWQR